MEDTLAVIEKVAVGEDDRVDVKHEVEEGDVREVTDGRGERE